MCIRDSRIATVSLISLTSSRTEAWPNQTFWRSHYSFEDASYTGIMPSYFQTSQPFTFIIIIKIHGLKPRWCRPHAQPPDTIPSCPSPSYWVCVDHCYIVLSHHLYIFFSIIPNTTCFSNLSSGILHITTGFFSIIFWTMSRVRGHKTKKEPKLIWP